MLVYHSSWSSAEPSDLEALKLVLGLWGLQSTSAAFLPWGQESQVLTRRPHRFSRHCTVPPIDHAFLLRELIKRDFRSRYAGASLGVAWSVLQPLWQLVLFSFVFSTVMKVDLTLGRARTESFPIFLFCALVPWGAVSEGISRSATAITDNAELVKKLRFPEELLVLTVVLGGALQSLLAGTIFLVVLAVLGQASLASLWVLLLVLPLQLALTLGAGFLAATANVFFRDTSHILQIFLQTWFFLTPIIYPLGQVPETFRGFLESNPLTAVVELYRHAFLGGDTVSVTSLLSLTTVATLMLLVGVAIFRSAKGVFADEI